MRTAPAAPATILFLGANPSETTRLALGHEAREIRQRLRGAKHRNAFRVEQEWAVRATDLQACLLQHRPAIVHFSGHGSRAGELMLHDETGRVKSLGGPALADLFRLFSVHVRCVVLNACFSEVQAEAIAEHVHCVIGMNAEVEDTAAIAFAGAFYQALGYGKDVQSAFDLGRNQMILATAQPGVLDLVSDDTDAGGRRIDVPRLLVREGVRAHEVRFVKAGAYTDALEQAGGVFAEASRRTTKERWCPAIDLGELLGRERELSALEAWIESDRCRLVLLLGMGGIGKTTLARALVEDTKSRFDYLYWQDVRNAPPLFDVLEDAIKFLSDQQKIELPGTSDARLLILLGLLRKRRCLLVLDNIEAIFQEGTKSGVYREEFADYGRLIRLIGEVSHRSCLLMTSRERPAELRHLEPIRPRVRTLSVCGIDEVSGQRLLAGRGLRGSKSEWERLIETYRGNPLALNLMASIIQTLFDGDLGAFLKEGVVTFGDVDALLREHLERLSRQGLELIHWLAIERDPVSVSDIAQDAMFLVAGRHGAQQPPQPASRKDLLEALDDLQERSLIEKSGSRFTLQPVVMEYITSRIISDVYQELASGEPDRLARMPLLKVQAKEYTRESQIRLILKPIADRLTFAFGEAEARERMIALLARIRARPAPGYAGGNVLNLLMQSGADVRNLDFGGMHVWHADLRDKVLHGVDFAGANFANCMFTQTFGIVLSVAFSPDGATFAAGTADGEVRVWESATGRQLLICRGHTGWVNSVAYTPDGRRFVSGSWDRSVRVWDAATGTPLMVLSGHTDKVRTVACSPDGSVIASGGVDRAVRIWNARLGTLVASLSGHDGWVISMAFSPDGRMLASAGSDGTVRLWAIDSLRHMRILEVYSGQVWAVAFAPDGALLASGRDDGVIQLWNPTTGELVRTLLGHTNHIKSVAFHKSGKLLVSGSTDHTARVWHVESGECLNTFIDHTNWVDAAGFSPEGETVLTGGSDHSIRLWKAATGQPLLVFKGYSNQVWSIAFSPVAKLLVSGSDDHMIHLWNLEVGAPVRLLSGHKNRVNGVAFSPDGEILASASHDRSVRVWDIASGECARVLTGHRDQVWSLAFGPDGRWLASGSSDNEVRIWEVATGRCIHVLKGHIDHVRAIAFSRDGALLATGCNAGYINLWDVATGELLTRLREHGNRPVWGLAFAPDGQTLASAGAGTTIHLWDMGTRTVRSSLDGHTDRIWALDFAADGRLASGSEDTTMRLWDIAAGTCTHVFEGHDAVVWSVAFSADGASVASAGGYDEIRVYTASDRSLLHVLRTERPYERMRITGATGLTSAQVDALTALGAVK